MLLGIVGVFWDCFSPISVQARLGHHETRTKIRRPSCERETSCERKNMYFEMISCNYKDVANSYHRLTSGGSAAADRSGRVRTPLTTHTFHARAPWKQRPLSLCLKTLATHLLFLGSPEGETDDLPLSHWV